MNFDNDPYLISLTTDNFVHFCLDWEGTDIEYHLLAEIEGSPSRPFSKICDVMREYIIEHNIDIIDIREKNSTSYIVSLFYELISAISFQIWDIFYNPNHRETDRNLIFRYKIRIMNCINNFLKIWDKAVYELVFRVYDYIDMHLEDDEYLHARPMQSDDDDDTDDDGIAPDYSDYKSPSEEYDAKFNRYLIVSERFMNSLNNFFVEYYMLLRMKKRIYKNYKTRQVENILLPYQAQDLTDEIVKHLI